MSADRKYFIDLQRDSTFTYEFGFAHEYAKSSGRWKKNIGNKLYFNSGVKNLQVPLNVKEKEMTKGRFLMIHSNMPRKAERPFLYYVYLNGINYCSTEEDSIIMIPLSTAIVSFVIQRNAEYWIKLTNAIPYSMALSTAKYKVKNKNGLVDCTIKVDDSLFFYHPFENYKVRIKKRGIIIKAPHQYKVVLNRMPINN